MLVLINDLSQELGLEDISSYQFAWYIYSDVYSSPFIAPITLTPPLFELSQCQPQAWMKYEGDVR